MNEDYELLENEEGVYVLINGIAGGEFTACSCSFEEDVGYGLLRKTNKKKITCEGCRDLEMYQKEMQER